VDDNVRLVDEVALELIFLSFFSFPQLIIITIATILIHLCPEVCDGLDQAVHYHILIL
jgi:hypothetical protein